MRMFDPKHEPFLTFARRDPAFVESIAVRRALEFLETGRLAAKFRWTRWGRGRCSSNAGVKDEGDSSDSRRPATESGGGEEAGMELVETKVHGPKSESASAGKIVYSLARVPSVDAKGVLCWDDGNALPHVTVTMRSAGGAVLGDCIFGSDIALCSDLAGAADDLPVGVAPQVLVVLDHGDVDDQGDAEVADKDLVATGSSRRGSTESASVQRRNGSQKRRKHRENRDSDESDDENDEDEDDEDDDDDDEAFETDGEAVETALEDVDQELLERALKRVCASERHAGFSEGDAVVVYHPELSLWYLAHIVAVKDEESTCKIRYEHWGKKWDSVKKFTDIYKLEPGMSQQVGRVPMFYKGMSLETLSRV